MVTFMLPRIHLYHLKTYFYSCLNVLPACMYHDCSVHMGAMNPMDYRDTCLWTSTWRLRNKSRFPVSEAAALSSWAISPAPLILCIHQLPQSNMETICNSYFYGITVVNFITENHRLLYHHFSGCIILIYLRVFDFIYFCFGISFEFVVLFYQC